MVAEAVVLIVVFRRCGGGVVVNALSKVFPHAPPMELHVIFFDEFVFIL